MGVRRETDDPIRDLRTRFDSRRVDHLLHHEPLMNWTRFNGLFTLPPARASVPLLSSTWLIRALKGPVIAILLSGCGHVHIHNNANAADAGICHGRHGRCS